MKNLDLYFGDMVDLHDGVQVWAALWPLFWSDKVIKVLPQSVAVWAEASSCMKVKIEFFSLILASVRLA